MQAGLTRKWRPRLWAVVLTVLAIVLCLPFAGLFLFRFYDSQLVQQTEESLLSQASVLSATYAELYANAVGVPPPALKSTSAEYAVFPSISINRETVLPPRPDPQKAQTRPGAAYEQIAPQLTRIANAAQTETLAGYRFLDTSGTVFAGTAEIGQDLGHVYEVRQALEGEVVTVARTRLRGYREPVLYTLSRGARVRVFVAMPIFADQKLIGAVYLSRTPNHIFRFLYGERFNLAKAAAFVALSTALIGYVFWRFITRPLQQLILRTRSAGQTGQSWEPPEKLGTREIADLGQSFQTLTQRLQGKQDALKTYTAHVTHELKSPLTALKGATELLRDGDISGDQKHKLLDTVDKSSQRIEDLLANMRAFSLADQQAMAGVSDLNSVLPRLKQAFPGLDILIENGALLLPVQVDTLSIMLTHLLENAMQHAAQQVNVAARSEGSETIIEITDDGSGISAGNINKIMEPFFTTRRDSGGTGMGLNIVKATTEALGGTLAVQPSETGACFQIRLG